MLCALLTIPIYNVFSEFKILPKKVTEPILGLFGLIGMQLTHRLKYVVDHRGRKIVLCFMHKSTPISQLMSSAAVYMWHSLRFRLHATFKPTVNFNQFAWVKKDELKSMNVIEGSSSDWTVNRIV